MPRVSVREVAKISGINGKIRVVLIFLVVVTLTSGCGGPTAQDAIDLHKDLAPTLTALFEHSLTLEWTSPDSIENRMTIAKAERELEKLSAEAVEVVAKISEIVEQLSDKELAKWEDYLESLGPLKRGPF